MNIWAELKQPLSKIMWSWLLRPWKFGGDVQLRLQLQCFPHFQPGPICADFRGFQKNPSSFLRGAYHIARLF